MKRAIWRSKSLAEITEREALLILGKCSHLEGCPGAQSETEPCFGAVRFGVEEPELGCPDRELRMSALVILTAARQLAPVSARRPADEPYFAPSREYFSDVLATLASAQAENDAMRALLNSAGIPLPTVEDDAPVASPQLTQHQEAT